MKGDHRVCFVGDSYIHGTADPDCAGWVGRVCARARARGVDLSGYNLGIRRDTSLDIAGRWQQECARRFRAAGIRAYVLFSFGINDTTQAAGRSRVSTARTLDALRGVLSASARRYPTLFVGPAPIDDARQNERIARLSPRMAGIAAEVGVPCLEVFDTLVDDPRWLAEVASSDGSHPRAWGYERLADLVDAWPAWWFGPQPPCGGAGPGP